MPENLVAVVEIPRGSSNKYEWDAELGSIKLDRLLFSSLGYATDYGFFRETLASDGDPLDAMIAVSEPTFPGCLIELEDLSMTLRDEISHFFSIYKTPERKVVKVDGWYSRNEALESIERARKRWREAQG
jgi:inorganic pyrophosphatase